MAQERPIIIATRGSALALAQTRMVLAQCRAAFPELKFEYQVIKTTGDKLQTASMSKTDPSLPKGLFTKELEVALLDNRADLAVHSLKDLPTELPPGLMLAATPPRENVRDVLIYRVAGGKAGRGFKVDTRIADLPVGATVATSSTRRKAQLLLARPDLNVVEIRGNVATRMAKVADRVELDATILALAGIVRLGFSIDSEGRISGAGVPPGLRATMVDLDTMLPCVGQGAIGIEIRSKDDRIHQICERLNHPDTFSAVVAERAFLSRMGGGCQSPVAAFAEVIAGRLAMRAVSFRDGPAKRASGNSSLQDAVSLGDEIAAKLG